MQKKKINILTASKASLPFRLKYGTKKYKISELTSSSQDLSILDTSI